MKNILLTPAEVVLDDPRTIVLHTGLKPDLPELEGLAVPGARHLDLRRNFRDTNSELPNTFPTPEQFTAAARRLGVDQDSRLVICDNIGNYSSPRAWLLFTVMGHENTYLLDGGLPAWVAAGGATEPLETSEFPTGNFTARPQPSWIATLADIETNLENKACLVIDARAAGRFAGTAPEPRAGLPSGHMPGSANIPFTRVLTEDHRFRSPEELRSLFATVNPERRPLIFSCGSGITASILLLAHRLAYPDERAQNFDGSWTEYALSGNLPIVVQQ